MEGLGWSIALGEIISVYLINLGQFRQLVLFEIQVAVMILIKSADKLLSESKKDHLKEHIFF